MSVDLYAGSQRARTREAGRDTWHSFSFGPHYDPANVAFGPLVAHNDEWLSPGSGYPDHAHRDVEIVTWVVSGTMAHSDDRGAAATLPAGTVQVQSAGAGVRHSEVARAEPVRFVQSWLVPDDPGGEPRVLVAHHGDESPGGWLPLAGGDGLPLRCAGATLWVARLPAGQALTVPPGRRCHLFVVTGRLRCDGVPGVLRAGDAVRLTDEPPPAVAATVDAEVLVWCLP